MMELVECSSVCLGSFNIYIFKPEWVVETAEIGSDARCEVTGDFNRPGIRLKFDGANQTIWTIRPEAVSVSHPGRRFFDCGKRIAKILTALPLTPAHAIGSNFVFRSDRLASTDEFDKVRYQWLLSATELSAEENPGVIASIKQDNAEFNLRLQAKENGSAELYVNVHRTGDPDRPNAASQAESAEKFADDFHLAKHLASQHLKIEVKHD